MSRTIRESRVVTSLLVTTALAVLPTQSQAQTHPEEVVEWVEGVGWVLTDAGASWMVDAYDQMERAAAMDRAAHAFVDPWSACYECQLAIVTWYWQQAVNDRNHRAFIDAIWGSEYADPDDTYHDGWSPWDAYGSGPMPYPGAYGYGTYFHPGPYVDYWDPMLSWYRQQASNDRSHRAFIDYIRN